MDQKTGSDGKFPPNTFFPSPSKNIFREYMWITLWISGKLSDISIYSVLPPIFSVFLQQHKNAYFIETGRFRRSESGNSPNFLSITDSHFLCSESRKRCTYKSTSFSEAEEFSVSATAEADHRHARMLSLRGIPEEAYPFRQ